MRPGRRPARIVPLVLPALVAVVQIAPERVCAQGAPGAVSHDDSPPLAAREGGALDAAPPDLTEATVEQAVQGMGPPAELTVSFDGLGEGFQGPQGTARFRNPSDN